MTQNDRRTVLQAAAGLVTATALTAACTTTGAAAHHALTAACTTTGAAAHHALTAACTTTGAAAHHAAPKPPTARSPRRIPGHPTHLTHGPDTTHRVALTFHGNGDPATAEAVLAEAERRGAHLTVLAVGSWLDANPGLARRILDAGHDLGNHTQHHLDINAMDEARARAEITDCAERLRSLTGSIGTWFRPSRAASPGMGGVSADGKVLWLSGRYDGEVYAIDTRTGTQLARIPVGSGPHGLAVYPQPGRYSLGHTGVFR